jgi:hypothetical protein
VGALGMSLAMASCGGPTRSVAAFCHVYWTTGRKMVDTFSKDTNLSPHASASQFLGALASLVDSPKMLATWFTKLEQVAPTTIEPAVATIQQSYAKAAATEPTQAEAMVANPLGALAGGLVGALQQYPAATKFTSWTAKHCGSSPPG